MITGRQIRAARALLDWSATDLAEKSGLTRETVSRVESDAVQAREVSLDKILRTFDEHGIEFTQDEGVKKKSDSITKLEGEQDFRHFMDQVYDAALQPYSCDGSKPICIGNLDNSLFRKYLGDYYPVHVDRLKKIPGLQIKSLAHAVDKNHASAASYLTYKYLEEFKSTAPFYVFGDKFAIIDFKVENPPRVLVIRSPSLANSYREQFEILWKCASVAPKN